MTRAEAIARQSMPPRLPDGWGASLSLPTRRAVMRRTPAPMEARGDAESTSNRLLALLHRMADAGERLPLHNAPLAALLGMEFENPSASIKWALRALENRAAIIIETGGNGRRTITLSATGQVLETEHGVPGA